jgi:hypothetical protein
MRGFGIDYPDTELDEYLMRLYDPAQPQALYTLSTLGDIEGLF